MMNQETHTFTKKMHCKISPDIGTYLRFTIQLFWFWVWANMRFAIIIIKRWSLPFCGIGNVNILYIDKLIFSFLEWTKQGFFISYSDTFTEIFCCMHACVHCYEDYDWTFFAWPHIDMSSFYRQCQKIFMYISRGNEFYQPCSWYNVTHDTFHFNTCHVDPCFLVTAVFVMFFASN